jgi:hypothetical protein
LPPAQRTGAALRSLPALGALTLAVLLLHLLLLLLLFPLLLLPRPVPTALPAAEPLHLRWLPPPVADRAAARAAAMAPVAAASPLAALPPAPPAPPAPPTLPVGMARPATPPFLTAPTAPTADTAAPAPAQALPGTRVPAPFEARFRLQRGADSGEATLRFGHDGQAYELVLVQQAGPRQAVTHLASRGQIGAAGLAPERFVEGRAGRDRRAISFEPAAEGGGRVRFSASDQAQPLLPALQDRLSWLLQLAARIEADPQQARPGQRLQLSVVGPRGDLDEWHFEVVAATATALHLHRAARRPWDHELEVWLDPQEHHLPLRLRWTLRGEHNGPGDGHTAHTTELVRSSLHRGP